MALAVQKQWSGKASAASVTITLSSPPVTIAAGDLLHTETSIFANISISPSAPTDSTSGSNTWNTRTGATWSSTFRSIIGAAWTAVSVAPTTVTLNGSAGTTDIAGTVAHITGAAASPIDTSTANTVAASSSPSHTAMSSAQADEVWFCAITHDGGALTPTQPSGFTLLTTTGNFDGSLGEPFASAYQIFTATQTSLAPQWSIAGGTPNNGLCMTAYKAAASAAGPPNFVYPPIRAHHPFKFKPGSRPRRGSSLILTASQFTLTLGGSTTPTGALANLTSKSLAGSVTPSGTLAKLISKALAGAITPVGSLVKNVSKALAGAISPSGSATKLVTKPLAGGVTPTGTITKLVTKILGGSATPAGALTNLKVVVLTLAGAITPSGSLTRLVSKSLSGSVTPSGAVTRFVSIFRGGVIAPSGNVAKLASKTLSGAVTPIGTLANAIVTVAAESLHGFTSGWKRRFGDRRDPFKRGRW